MGRLKAVLKNLFRLEKSTRERLRSPAKPAASLWTILIQAIRNPRAAWVSIQEAGAVLRPCWLAAVIVVGASAALHVSQAVDSLLSVAERGFFSGRNLSLLVSSLILAGAGWYFPRALLYVRYWTTPPGSGERMERLRRWVPRLLGVLPPASIAIAYAGAGRLRFALFYAVVAMVFLRVLIVRRYLLYGPAARSTVPLHDRLPRRTFNFLLFLLALSLSLLLTFLISPVSVPQKIGPIGILLVATASWVAFGSLALIYPTYRFRLPSLLVIMFLLAVVFSAFNDNHQVRVLGEEAETWQRDSVAEHFGKWLDIRRDGWDRRYAGEPYPVFVVAAEGGGIRAAYWTASVLAHLEDVYPGFACHVFALSGVSGGSLGGAVFAALVAERLDEEAYACDGRLIEGSRALLPKVRKILDDDFLGPALAGMFFPDFTQRFWPFPGGQDRDRSLAFPDRAEYLERAWESAWRKEFDSDRFAKSFRDLWRDGDRLQVPSLFLNGTWVETGGRNVTSNLGVAAGEFVNLDDVVEVLPGPIRLSTAVHMSARFTFVSPAGTLAYEEDGRRKVRRLVDGGYFENSGAMTAAEILSVITGACGAGCEIEPTALVISNNPQNLNNPQEPPDESDASRRILAETLSPVLTFLNTRSARGYHAEDSLGVKHRVLRFQLTQVDNKALPLGWMLAPSTRRRMVAQVHKLPSVVEVGSLLAPDLK